MRKLLISTTALSVALSPIGTFPVYAQSLADDGSVIAPDGTVLCMPTADAGCDIDGIIAAYQAAEAEAAAIAQAEADAIAAAEAEAAAMAEAMAAEQAAADQAAADQAAADQAAADQAAADQAAADQAAADQAAADQAAADQAAADQAAADQAAADQAAADQAAADQAAADQAAADQAAADQAATDQAAADQAAADQAAADQAAADEAAAEQMRMDDEAKARLAEQEAAEQAAADAAAMAEALAAEQAAAQAEADAAQAAADAAAQAAAEAAAAGDAEAAAAAAALAEEEGAAALAAQAVADAAAQAEMDAANAAAQAEADMAQAAIDAAQAEADAAQAAADAAAQAEADAAAQADADAAAQATADAAAQAEADAAQAEADAAQAAADAEALVSAGTDPVDPETVAPVDGLDGVLIPDGVIDAATGEIIDADVAAKAVAEAEEELAISETGEFIDPAANLKVAEPDLTELVDPVDVPEVSDAEVESLSQLLTIDPTVINPEALGAAETIVAPAADGSLPKVYTPDPASLIADVTEVINADDVRSSDEEFAAAPVELSKGKKNKLSDLEKAGLVVLGALVVGAIIKSNNDRKEEERRVVSNTGDRIIVLRPDGTYQVLKDDDTIIRTPGSTVQTETFRDGSTRTIVSRDDGTQVVTIRDATGRVLRRATYDDLGREVILIDDLAQEEVVIVRSLPKPKKKIVISTKDDDAALKRELAALEADKAGRKFSLRQIREIPEVRALAATIDVEPVTFASGSAAIKAEEARALADLGQVMLDLLEVNPAEVFLIMGHTDATGKAALNLALSDRRAESVALALTEYFDIPPENMIVQGYGETELLIDTQDDEPLNRRVEVKVITPLMSTSVVE